MKKRRIGHDSISFCYLCACLLFVLPLFVACSLEEVGKDPQQTETAGWNTCKVFMNVSRTAYSDEGDTRAALTWQKGDCIYVTIQGEGTQILGKVVCEGGDDWTLYYEGILPQGTYTGRACYINKVVNAGQTELTLDAQSGVYVDSKMTCERNSAGVWITTSLNPQTGRIRFQGEPDMTLRVSGVWHYAAFSLPDATLRKSDATVELTVGNDGFTPFCYCSLPQESRTLFVAYDNYLFTTLCEHPILDVAQAGYMEIPTEEKHNGWEMTVISLPTLGQVTTLNIGTHSAMLSSSIVSDGNADISDCGFCWSTSPNPSLADAYVSYGVPMGSDFSKTLSNLTDNTTYHVRAYAVNQLGVSYSEDFQFTTLAIVLPTLSSVNIQSEEDGSATFKAVVTSDGRGTVVESGFVYSTHEMPTLADTKLVSSDRESLTARVESLPIGTRYYVRAFATNEKGTSYSTQSSFIAGGGRPGDDDINRPIL